MKAMKQFASMIVFCVISATAFAERIAPPTLVSVAFADTEVSTNIAIAPLVGGRSLPPGYISA